MAHYNEDVFTREREREHNYSNMTFYCNIIPCITVIYHSSSFNYCIYIYRIAGYIGGNNMLEKERKLQLADINLAVTVQLPRLLQALAQYWRI